MFSTLKLRVSVKNIIIITTSRKDQIISLASLCFFKRAYTNKNNMNINNRSEIDILKNVFNKCVESVKPITLFNNNKQKKCLEINIKNTIQSSSTSSSSSTATNTIMMIPPVDDLDAAGGKPIGNNHNEIEIELKISDSSIDDDNVEILKLKPYHQCHLIGFGKAVFGMACEMEKILGNRLKYGILSVPFGTMEKFQTDANVKLRENSVIRVYEGAKNNIPDHYAECTARKIQNYITQLTDNDILFVLISGGGSALLPLPMAPITLDEKIELIKRLAGCGATITELNIVRRDISAIKGGKLLKMAKNAHKIISLILSDVINDPLDIIASGPTIQLCRGNEINLESSQEILKKYHLWDSVCDSIKTILINELNNRDQEEIYNLSPFDDGDGDNNKLKTICNSSSYIIGNNKVAIQEAIDGLKAMNYKSLCLSSEIQGNVIAISNGYLNLSFAIQNFIQNLISINELEIIVQNLKPILYIREQFLNDLLLILSEKVKSNGICLVAGGEITVNVTGNGLGGRNQELALRFAYDCYKFKKLPNISLLSAGTDGIDGPTIAAGAIGNSKLIETFIENDNLLLSSIIEHIDNNDSYNFFNKTINNNYHIITGHTGTNVMDIHILMIPIE